MAELILSILNCTDEVDLRQLQNDIINNFEKYIGDNKEDWLMLIKDDCNLYNKLPKKLKEDRDFNLECIKLKNIPYISKYRDDYEIAIKMFKIHIDKLNNSILIKDEKFINDLIESIDKFNNKTINIFLNLDIDIKIKDNLVKKLDLNKNIIFNIFLDNYRDIALILYRKYSSFIRVSKWKNDEDFIKELIPNIKFDTYSKFQEFFKHCIMTKEIEDICIKNNKDFFDKFKLNL
jgi:hypothetical protein